MSIWTPKFTLWDDTGSTKLYTFTAVNDTNAPQTVKDLVKVKNLRGKGQIVIDGGTAPWQLEIKFVIIGEDYTDVASQIETLENTIQLDTPYLFLMDKSISTYYQYNVKRTKPFTYTDLQNNLRNNYQKITAHLDVNSW